MMSENDEIFDIQENIKNLKIILKNIICNVGKDYKLDGKIFEIEKKIEYYQILLDDIFIRREYIYIIDSFDRSKQLYLIIDILLETLNLSYEKIKNLDVEELTDLCKKVVYNEREMDKFYSILVSNKIYTLNDLIEHHNKYLFEKRIFGDDRVIPFENYANSLPAYIEKISMYRNNSFTSTLFIRLLTYLMYICTIE